MTPPKQPWYSQVELLDKQKTKTTSETYFDFYIYLYIMMSASNNLQIKFSIFFCLK